MDQPTPSLLSAAKPDPIYAQAKPGLALLRKGRSVQTASHCLVALLPIEIGNDCPQAAVA